MQNIEKLIYNLRHLRQLDSLLMHKAMKTQSAHFQHLVMIQQITKDGPVAISRIKDSYHVSAPAATQLIALLEKQGYIDRVKSEKDKRSSLIQLSKQGLKTLDEGAQFFEEGINPLIEYLGEEDSKNFNRILERMIEYFDTNQDNYEKK